MIEVRNIPIKIPDIDPAIEDWIELRMQSLNKSNIDVFIDALEKHKISERESRQTYRKELNSEVRSEIKATVNGKIDKLNIQLVEILKKLDEIKPFIEASKERENAWNVFVRGATKTSIVAGVIAAFLYVGKFVLGILK